jgi:hypothetical protein
MAYTVGICDFGQRGGYCGVADVSVDFDLETPTDDHRCQLGMVDVRRYDCAWLPPLISV